LSYYFYDTIYGLRKREEIILYNRLLDFDPAEEQMVADFLALEYKRECISYPFTPPLFDASAALWAAKTIYIFSQLMLNRDNPADDLPQLLPVYDGMMDAGAVLSADLCLRFLVELVPTIRNIDSEDPLLQILHAHLHLWHYSGTGLDLKTGKVNMEAFAANDCLMQLYADRVVEKRDIKRAMVPDLYQRLKTGMGLYSPVFWKELKTVMENE